MRRSLLAIVLAASTASALFACEEDPSSSSSGGFSPEAGTFEASVTDTGAPVQADAAAPVDAEASTAVSVRVTQGGAPLPNVLVVFHDAQGAVLGTVKTAADGRATSSGATPAMASALLGRGNDFHVVTWTAIEAGDELLAVEPAPQPAPLPFLDVSFTPFVGAVNGYEVAAGPCTSVGPSSPVRVALYYPECLRPNLPVLGSTRDEGGNTLFAFLKAAAPPTDGGIASASIGAFAASAAASVDATNAPNEAGDLRVGMTDIVGGVGFPYPSLFVDGPRVFRVPSGFADARQVYATFDAADSSAHLSIIRREVPAAASVIDFSQRLPKVTSTEVPPVADPRRFEVKWTSEAALGATDGGLVRVRFFTNRDANFAWSFVVPPGSATSGSVKAPAMPAEAAGSIPDPVDAGGASFDLPNVLFVDSSSLASYAAFRRVAATVVDRDAYGPRELAAVLPQNGTLRATSNWENAR